METLIMHQLEEFSMNVLRLISHSAQILNKLGNCGAYIDTSETQPSLVNIPFYTHFGDHGQLPPVMHTPEYERPIRPCLLKMYGYWAYKNTDTYYVLDKSVRQNKESIYAKSLIRLQEGNNKPQDNFGILEENIYSLPFNCRKGKCYMGYEKFQNCNSHVV